jgi:hypothetical protein
MELGVYLASDCSDSERLKQATPLGRGEAVTIPLAPNLNVGLVIGAPLQREFPTDSILGYLLSLRDPRNTSDGRSWTSSIPELSLPPFATPTFVLPSPRARQQRILHGSCRKLSGLGADSSVEAEGVLLETAALREARPQALLLTGDQIYADDVSSEIAAFLIPRATDLLGGLPETMSWNGSLRPLTEFNSTARNGLVDRFLSVDRGSGENHLLGFTEFAYMYLMSWNEDNWPTASVSHDLQVARQAIPAFRRTLANTPTYMLLDDHEVTDDWNLDAEWSHRAKSEVPRRILANGVAAYWAFQAWGNDPGRFGSRGLGSVIHRYLADEARVANAETPSNRSLPGYCAAFLGQHWDFSAPTSPPTLFIDSRTHRDLGSKGAPPLIDRSGERAMADLLDGMDIGGRVLIVITATPLFGLRAIESKLDRASHSLSGWNLLLSLFGVSFGGVRAAEYFDRESWRSNDLSFLRVCRSIVKRRPKACIVLSGDVHYAFGVLAEYNESGRRLLFVQFTSSSLKNAPSQSKKMALASFTSGIPTSFETYSSSLPRIRQPREVIGNGPTVESELLPLITERIDRETAGMTASTFKGSYWWTWTNLGDLTLTDDQAFLTWRTADSSVGSTTVVVSFGEHLT